MEKAPAAPPASRDLEVRMDITDRCNLRCPHCVRHDRTPGSGHEMEAGMLGRIAQEVFPRAHTVHLSCAGEPLMSSLFESSVELATSARVPRVCMVTNGALLNEKRARYCIDRGVAEVTFSLESSQPERFARTRLGTTMAAVLANVDRLRALRDERRLRLPQIRFNVIVMRENLDELDAIADLCRAHGAEHVRFGFLVLDNEEMRSEAPVRMPGATNAALDGLRRHVAGWPVDLDVPRNLGGGRTFQRCHQAWTGLFISADGDVWPCFRLQGEPLGSLANQTLEEIVSGAEWKLLHREHALGRVRPVCDVCVETGNHDRDDAWENALRIPPRPGAPSAPDPADPEERRLQDLLVEALERSYRGDRRRSDEILDAVIGPVPRGDAAAHAAIQGAIVSADVAWISGRLMEHRGDTAGVIAAYARFLELAPPTDPRLALMRPWLERVRVEHALGEALRALRSGDAEASRRHLGRAIAIDPGRAIPSGSLASALEACDPALLSEVRLPGTLLGIADLAQTAWAPYTAADAIARYLEVVPDGQAHGALRKALGELPRRPPASRWRTARAMAGRVAGRIVRPPRASQPAAPSWEAPRGLSLRMDVNNRCNLSCVQCTLASRRAALGEAPSDMPLDLFRRIATEVLPSCSTAAISCEAEPTLHPEIDSILRAAAVSPGTELFMTTNGMALTDGLLEAMLDLPLAGLNVSIDGAREDSFARIRRHGSLARVARGLDELLAAKARRGVDARHGKPRLQINVTLMRSNLDELPDIARLAHGWGAARLTLQHVYSFDENGLRAESLELDPERSDATIAETEAMCRALGIETTFPAPFGRPERPAGPPGPPASRGALFARCRAPWTMLHIWWDGRVFPCDLWGTGRESLGDLRRQSFREIWDGAAYGALRQGLSGRGRLHEACAGCSRVTTDNLEERDISTPLVLTPRA